MAEEFREDFVDDNVDVTIEDENDSVPMPEPSPPEPPATEPTPMPSDIPREAWRNVEEMLVTLSNNVRVNLGELRDKITESVETGRKTHAEIMEALERLIQTSERQNQLMDEFNRLLESAVVEPDKPSDTTPPGVTDINEGKRRRGYISRKRGA